ncbi:protein C2-DOMAIN ABA-RELATED 10-like [Salvia divinorum]|uniref:Protein C2-DOMAIN ABA-RELATED 10-like n=1 Tax=Salvia divinorum TaxID=28513 RepID=A0ABD1IL97_SALDI
MDGLGLLRIRKVKTRVEKDNCNPVWNEDLTILIKDINAHIILRVYDNDTFTGDDMMGEAEIDIKPLVECLKMDLPDRTQLARIEPSSANWLSKESYIMWNKGKLVQPMTLILGGGVECGELHLQIQWLHLLNAN